ncbi:MAG: type II toxin-antitoxin system VapC family toxin [Acidimicrobiales bacterium]
MSDEILVIDASALVDLVLGEALGSAVRERVDGAALHAPAHLDAEVLSALGRMHRAGRLTSSLVARQLDAVAAAPIVRHLLPELLVRAWSHRSRLRLADALYVQLAADLAVPLVTTDARLGRAVRAAEVIGGRQ